MTVRLKTIEYGFNQLTASFAANVYGAHKEKIISVPENNTRTFQSVWLYHFAQQNAAAAASPTALSSSFRLFGPGSAVQKTVITASTIANSGESVSACWVHDLTSYFQTNFSGTYTAMTAACSGGWSVTPFANLSTKLIITYTYEDSTLTGSNKAIKTIRIPLEGATGNLTTTLAYRDSIPALATFCPESNKLFRNIFFEAEANTNTTAAAAPNPVLNLSLDAEAAQGDFGIDDTLASAQYYYRIWQRDDMDVSSSHNVSASTSVAGTTFPCLALQLVATYEYEPANSTSVLNSLELPAFDEPGNIGGNAVANANVYGRIFTISDKGPISMSQSAVKAYYTDGGAVTVDLRIGAQTSRTYAHAAAVRAGSLVCQRRIDPGGTTGTGFTLNRGKNDFKVTIFRTGTTSTTLGSNLNGVMILNYTSSVNPEGIESNTKTIKWLLQESTPTLTVPEIVVSSSVRTPTIPESYYQLLSYGAFMPVMWLNTAAGQSWVTLQANVLATEKSGANAGWENIYIGTKTDDSETGVYPCYGASTFIWKRNPDDPYDGLEFEQPRKFRICSVPASAVTLQGWHLFSYSSRQFSKTGSIYPNPGANQTVRVYRDDLDELIMTASTDANGRYIARWHNDTIPLYSEIRVSDTQVGRSGIFYLTGSG